LIKPQAATTAKEHTIGIRALTSTLSSLLFSSLLFSSRHDVPRRKEIDGCVRESGV